MIFFFGLGPHKKSALAEIGTERRNGYSWHSDAFDALQKKYNNWCKKGM